MSDLTPTPGILRGNRVSEEGLSRLRAQLERGVRISPGVLTQWIRRYGEDARKILKAFGCYSEELEP